MLEKSNKIVNLFLDVLALLGFKMLDKLSFSSDYMNHNEPFLQVYFDIDFHD